MKFREIRVHPVYISIALVLLLSALAPLGISAQAADDLKINLEQPLPSSKVETTDFSRLPSLREFISRVQNGSSDDLVGVYVPGVLAFPIVDQPSDNFAFVSPKKDVVTLFGLARKNDTIGLLAHNDLAGRDFNKLLPLMRVIVVYGNGSIQSFLIKDVQYFHALQPYSPYSEFEDVENLGVYLTAGELFKLIYGNEDRLVFQTCIEAEGEPAWGRLFVTAEQVSTIGQLTTSGRTGVGSSAR